MSYLAVGRPATRTVIETFLLFFLDLSKRGQTGIVLFARMRGIRYSSELVTAQWTLHGEYIERVRRRNEA